MELAIKGGNTIYTVKATFGVPCHVPTCCQDSSVGWFCALGSIPQQAWTALLWCPGALSKATDNQTSLHGISQMHGDSYSLGQLTLKWGGVDVSAWVSSGMSPAERMMERFI